MYAQSVKLAQYSARSTSDSTQLNRLIGTGNDVPQKLVDVLFIQIETRTWTMWNTKLIPCLMSTH